MRRQPICCGAEAMTLRWSFDRNARLQFQWDRLPSDGWRASPTMSFGIPAIIKLISHGRSAQNGRKPETTWESWSCEGRAAAQASLGRATQACPYGL